jgi:type IV pilus assembly protein PilB
LERLAISEAAIVTEDLKEMIINRRQALNVGALKNSQLFISLKQDGIFKVLSGVTSINEVMRVVEIENL